MDFGEAELAFCVEGFEMGEGGVWCDLRDGKGGDE